MPDKEEIKATLLGIFKEEFADIWDGEEDTEFFKEIVEDVADLRLRKLRGEERLDRQIELVIEKGRQRLQQKANRIKPALRDAVEGALRFVIKLAVGL